MKCCTKIILAALSAFLLSAGITAAQVGPDGNLAYSLSDYQLNKPATNNAENFIIRNRLDSGCTWTASADALIMTRVGGKSATLVQNTNGGELLAAKDIDFPWAAGERVGIVGEDVLCGCDLEASFFGLDWVAQQGAIAPGQGADIMVFNDAKFSLTQGEVVNYRYVSQLRSMEINARHPLWERLSVLLGFRYMELHEEEKATVVDEELIDANVDNHLYGGQIGMNVAFVNTCRYSIEGVMKAGVFGNHSDLAMRVRDVAHFADSTSHTAFMGEIGLMGIVQITNHLSLRGGYQVMWLDGIALAGDQIENTGINHPQPYMGGTMLIHGATAGLEYAF